jgi:AcrR family transcriptional regulator
VRRIAAAARVSPALVIHHFGSKDALKEDCDRHVAQTLVELKRETMAQPGVAAETGLLYQLAHADSYGYLVGYLLHAVGAGGQSARRFLAVMTEATTELVRRGVEAGTMRPSRDPEAQARFMAYSAIGALLVWQAARPAPAEPGGRPDPSADQVDALLADFALPTLELYTEGLFTSPALLDAYLAAAPRQAAPVKASGDHRHEKDRQ